MTHLRGVGVDDEGGWDTAATENIPVSDAVPPDDGDTAKLCTAATALRDLYMGWGPEQVVDLEGGIGGLPNLVREIATELRGRGIDDEGGWDCIEIRDDAVARAPGFR